MSPVSAVVDCLNSDPDLRSVTKIVSPTHIVRATRRFYRKSGKSSQTFVLTIGRPNTREREIIREYRKAMEPFPVKKMVLRYKANRKRRR